MRINRYIAVSYIYGLVDPRSQSIRYVGKSDAPAKRLKQHLFEAARTKKGFWIRSLRKNGLLPELLILECVRESAWQERERFWINSIGVDNLVNGTEGGDGGRQTEDVRKAIGEKSKAVWSDPIQRKRILDSRRLGWDTEEARQRASTAQKRRYSDLRQVEVNRQAQLASWEKKRENGTATKPEIFKEKMRKNWADPAYCSRLTEAIRKGWDAPGVKEKAAESQKAKWQDPEERQKRVASMKAGWASPEARGRMRLAAKQGWETRRRKKEENISCLA